MDFDRDLHYKYSPELARLRRTYSASIYVAIASGAIFLALPVSRFSTTLALLNSYYALTEVIGAILLFTGSLIWLMRYLQYGIISSLVDRLPSNRAWAREEEKFYWKHAFGQADDVEPVEKSEGEKQEESIGPDNFKSSIIRISAEVAASGRRNNANMVFGIGMAVLGITMISTSLFGSQEPQAKSLEEFLLHFIPRLSLATFIELFAYFFLRLYRNGLAEIKYLQNELTNIEARKVAIEHAHGINDKKTLEKILFLVAKTERNGVLEKGQTTVAIQMAAQENKSLSTLSKAISSATSKSASDEKS